MLKVAIIIGSTRPGRKAGAVARWVYDIASKRSDASFEVVDIAAFDLPLLDEAVSYHLLSGFTLPLFLLHRRLDNMAGF